MTLRERIADWLTGGAITRANARVELYHGMNIGALKLAEGYRDGLRAISAEAKRGKNPNATVRRMGKMADEALG